MKSTRVSLNEINRVNVISDKLNDMSLSLEIDSQWDKLIVQSQEIMNSKNLQNISSLLRNMENLLNSIKDKNAQHKKKNEHIQYLYGQFCEIAENKTIECLSLHDHGILITRAIKYYTLNSLSNKL
ncbi:hypothetical protein A3Q56_08001 [Intoshia linei]|uniref:Uncharacterized protein n=1 Tax=Intoshia linei TaxID=1819745 RepID=A0A177AQM3_9BILA|nr:hypothetical protein A3Q56_08001 [Intoshia linei]